MPVLGNSVGNIALTAFITSILHKRIGLATRLLEGLRCYRISSAGASLSSTATKESAITPRLSKQQAAKAKKTEIDIGEAATVSAVPLSASQIESSAFYGYLDYMVACVPAMLANCLLNEAYQAFGLKPNLFPAVFATITVGLALRGLIEVTLMTSLSSSLDKQCTWVAGVLSGTAAMAVLVLTPKDVLSFNTAAASKDVSLAIGAFMRSRATTPEGQHIPDPQVPAILLDIGLATLGAVVGGLLLTPIIRITCSFASATRVPTWGRQQLSFPIWVIGFLQLNLVLPAVATIVWVTPLFQEPLDVPALWMPGIKAAVMLCIALVQLINTRSLVQSYLNSGLRQWHQLKHGSRVSTPGMKTGEVIAIKLRTLNILTVKVALQCLAPATSLTGCAMLVLQHSMYARQTYLSSAQTQMLQGLLRLWVCTADFCGWWTCACWFVYAAASLALLKAGVLQA